MDIDKIINEYLFKGNAGEGSDIRGSQAHLLFQRFRSAKDIDERIALTFLAVILLIGIVTNDKSLVAKAKVKGK